MSAAGRSKTTTNAGEGRRECTSTETVGRERRPENSEKAVNVQRSCGEREGVFKSDDGDRVVVSKNRRSKGDPKTDNLLFDFHCFFVKEGLHEIHWYFRTVLESPGRF